MKVQEVLLRAMGGQISWVQAGEILGLCPRQVRRLRQRFEDHGYKGLFDRRREPSPKRVPLATVERVLRLYREEYADFNVQLGDHDFVRLEHAVETLKLIPNAELAVTPDAGHFALYSEKEKVVPIVQLFLEKPETRIPVASAGMGYHPSETR